MNKILNKIADMERNAAEIKGIELSIEQNNLSEWQEQVLLMTENIEGNDMLNHNVNLSTVADLKKFISDSKNVENDFNKIKDELNKVELKKQDILSKKSNLFKYVSKLNSNANRMLSDFEQKTKEIGLNPNDNDSYNQANKLYNSNAEIQDKLDNIK